MQQHRDVLGMLAFCHLVRPYSRVYASVVVGAAVAYLGSPLWHYGRTLFAESFLAFLSVTAFTMVLRSERYLVAGLLIAAGVLIKLPFVVFGIPLIVDAVFRRRWDQAIKCAVPALLAIGLLLTWNRNMHGAWFKFPQSWEWGFPVEGLFGLVFSWKNGLLLFSPAIVAAFIAVPEWFRRFPREATLIATAAGLYLAVMACWAQWWGGTCYSARLILSIVPLLFAPLVVLLDSEFLKTDSRILWMVGTLTSTSILFGAVGAFACEHVWGKHPLQLLF